MMNIKNWTTFNELYQDTYYSAANKLRYGTKRSDDLRNHAKYRGIYNDNRKFLENLEFNIFTYVNTDEEGEDNYPNEILKYKMSQYIEIMENTEALICLNKILTTEENEQDSASLYITIYFKDNLPNIDLGYANNVTSKYPKKLYNKFADRKSMRNFKMALKKLYFTDNPNLQLRAISKINKTKVTEILPTEIDGDNNFWKFLSLNDCDWDKFEKNINFNDLWDNLMPKKEKPMWVSNNTWDK